MQGPLTYRPLGIYQVSDQTLYLSLLECLTASLAKITNIKFSANYPTKCLTKFRQTKLQKNQHPLSCNIFLYHSLFPVGEYFEHTGEQNREPTNSERAQCRILRPFLTQVHNVINHLKCENISVCKGFTKYPWTIKQNMQLFEQTNFRHFSVHQHHNSVEVIGKVQI